MFTKHRQPSLILTNSSMRIEINTSYSYGCSILSLKRHKIYTWHKEAFINLVTFIPRELGTAVTFPRWRTWGIYWASQVTVTCSTARVFRCQSKVSILVKNVLFFSYQTTSVQKVLEFAPPFIWMPSLKKSAPSPCLHHNSKLAP